MQGHETLIVVHSHHCHTLKLLITDSTNCPQTRKQASHVLISHIIVFFFFTSNIRTNNFVPWILLFPVGLDTFCEQKFQKPSTSFPSTRQAADKTT